ncbi:MAG TPA: ferredoxin family protein [Sorangium sp.]|uniref:4Fe-4S ferredoxin n=1 Tax=Sorangium cellulosum TaxID=56 RepID=A0A150R5H6_SORCE|nr:4Fe-4S ferredoxin [Sorangium cellulosum]HTN87810.1 ferredoxin family protein [Sorangium sp.]
MGHLLDRESVKAKRARTAGNAEAVVRFDLPVVVEEASCIKGCRICIDSCPVDCLAVNPDTGKAHMAYDECWYCLACEIDCPKEAITVKIPFLIR